MDEVVITVSLRLTIIKPNMITLYGTGAVLVFHHPLKLTSSGWDTLENFEDKESATFGAKQV